MKRLSMAVAAGLAALWCAGGSVSAQAEVIYSWENASQGWGSIAGYSTTTGVTEGTHAAAYDAPVGFSWGMQTGNWALDFAALNAAQKTGAKILLDITGPNEDPGEGAVSVGIWIWHNGANTSLGSYEIPTDGSTNTYEFDFATPGVGGDPGIDWTQARIWSTTTEGYDPGVLYIDNLRIEPIPEPASLVLAVSGGLLLLQRVRR